MELKIGETIRRLRRDRDVTQEEFAARIGVSAQAVSKWERAEGYPDITLLPAIAGFFGITLDALCGLDKEKERAEIEEIIHEAWKPGGAAATIRQKFCGRAWPSIPIPMG